MNKDLPFIRFIELMGVVAGITELMIDLDEEDFQDLWKRSISELKIPAKRRTEKEESNLYLGNEYLRWVESIRMTEKK